MRHPLRVFAVALAAALTVGASAAYAQGRAVVADVPFAFQLGNKTLEPGQYTFRPGDQNEMIQVTSQKGASVLLPVETRIGNPAMEALGEGRLVFDKVGDRHYLSEIWIPAEDGYLVRDTRGPHEHVHVAGIK